MKKQKSSGGLASSAGLVRYFDSESKTSIQLNPKIALAVCFVFGLLILVFNWTL
jgi:preprotein translocase subunit Sec61beta